jgi:hypothetical protein
MRWRQEVRTAILRAAQSRDLASLQQQWEAHAPDILIVDQFADLYTLVGRSEAEEFISLMVSNADAARTRSVISFRSDFVSQAIANPALARILSTATFFAGGLTNEQLRRTIVGPARVSGLSFEPGLIERLVADVGTEPGNLSQMQLVLNSLVRSSPDGHSVTHFEYDRIGGAPGVIARQCEDFWDALSLAERQSVRSVLLRLVTPAQTRRVRVQNSLRARR